MPKIYLMRIEKKGDKKQITFRIRDRREEERNKLEKLCMKISQKGNFLEIALQKDDKQMTWIKDRDEKKTKSTVIKAYIHLNLIVSRNFGKMNKVNMNLYL